MITGVPMIFEHCTFFEKDYKQVFRKFHDSKRCYIKLFY